ncbi:hypothetical protein ACQP1G_25705 [Nocardia sp. CA-107356]|uniref:hypothetical protein n=1 Tax=Nocardia sp. CA-107356 TaxID=3239972 RepID=UPI003D91431C
MHHIEPLPSARKVLCAVRSRHHTDDHPAARWDSPLADWHRTSSDSAYTDAVRGEYCQSGYLVHRIDLAIEQHSCGGTLHTETVGLVSDRIADARVRAETVPTTAATTAEPRVHTAWHRLLELVDGYDDVAGSRRLPVPAGGD